jgi:hypothetical protein
MYIGDRPVELLTDPHGPAKVSPPLINENLSKWGLTSAGPTGLSVGTMASRIGGITRPGPSVTLMLIGKL